MFRSCIFSENMKIKAARWIAWSIVAVFVILATVGLILQAASDSPYTNAYFPALVTLIALVTGWIIIGALIISRHPRHPVGWLLCTGLFFTAFDMFSAGYAAYDAYRFAGTLPGVNLALIWLRLVSLGPHGLIAFTLVILLYPDGQFPSPGWRKVAWTAVGALLVLLPLQALEPGPVEPDLLPEIANPLGIDPAFWVYLKPLMWTAFSVLALCYLAAFYSLFVRLRKSRGDARQQVKWLVFPVGLYVFFILLFFVGKAKADPAIVNFGVALGQLGIAGQVIAVAFGIFKYRLYDLEFIINRTLIYSALTGTLAGVYLVSVTLLQRLLPSNSPLVIVVSTLAIAGLFNPIRVRIQDAVDRLFYRHRYDARLVLDAFANKARLDTDLERLTDDLLEVIGETFQPASLSLFFLNGRKRK